jgi:hypothetical protein
MPLRQLVIQACKGCREISVNREGGGGPMHVVPHHLDVADRPEHGAQPQQLVA